MKFSKNDVIFASLMLVIISFFSFLLYQNYMTRIEGGKNLQPVGTVVYKYHTVKRKYHSRFVWESVLPKTPIYLLDSIITQEQSDAIINLDSGLKVEMDANSLVEIDIVDDNLGLKLKSGGITAAGNGNNKQTKIRASDGSIIDVSKGKAHLTQGEKGFQVAVKKGEVSVGIQGRKAKRMAAGKVLQVDADGNSTERRISINLLLPEDGGIISSTHASAGKKMVTLKWSGKNISRYKVFWGTDLQWSGGGTIVTNKMSLDLPLANGLWYWRVEGTGARGIEISIPQSFKILPAEGIVQYSPANQTVIPYLNEQQTFFFSWDSPISSDNYILTLALDKKLVNKVKAITTTNKSLVVAGLKPNLYYWNIRQRFFASDGKEIVQSGPVYSFIVQDKDSKKNSFVVETDKKFPDEKSKEKSSNQFRLLYPINKKISIGSLAHGYLNFSWQGNAREYVWELAEKVNKKKIIILQRKVKKNQFRLLMSESLYSGVYSWRVFPVYSRKQKISKARWLTARFYFINPPRPPRIESVVNLSNQE